MDAQTATVSGRLLDRIPGLISDVLGWVQRIDPTAIVGGGFLRDLALGAEPKDVDIFVGPAFSAAKFVATYPGWIVVASYDTAASYGPAFSDELKAIFTLVPPHGWALPGPPFQVIQMNRAMTVADQLDRFDFHACRAVFDGLCLTVGDRFWDDIQNRTLTYALEPSDDRRARRAERRAERLTARLGLRAVWP